MLKDLELNYIEKWLPEASVKYKDGSPAVNLGLIITVFFKNGHMPDVRRKMVECVDRYYGEFKPYLKKTMAPKWVGITEKTIRKSGRPFWIQRPRRFFLVFGKRRYGLSRSGL